MAFSSFFRRGLVLVGLLVLVLGLGACGKRPPLVEAPPGGASTARVYPDIATDPRP